MTNDWFMQWLITCFTKSHFWIANLCILTWCTLFKQFINRTIFEKENILHHHIEFCQPQVTNHTRRFHSHLHSFENHKHNTFDTDPMDIDCTRRSHSHSHPVGIDIYMLNRRLFLGILGPWVVVELLRNRMFDNLSGRWTCLLHWFIQSHHLPL